MKLKILLFLYFPLVFISSIGYSQDIGPNISELKGMEDFNGKTHLFYRLYTFSGDAQNYTSSNSLYHFDLSNYVDTLFLYEGGHSNAFSTPQYSYALAYTFWNDDPSKVIYKVVSCGTDCVGSVFRFDNPTINQSIFFFDFWPVISISNQNDSLLYTSATNHLLAKSSDGGINWSFINPNDYLGFLSVSKFDDSVLFVLDVNNNILKSIDSGNSFYLVDTTKSTTYPKVPEIFYDRDSTHIYHVSFFFNGTNHIKYLSVSNNKGENDSWVKKYTGINSVTIDYSQTGVLYIAENNKILISQDYGNSFSTFRVLDSIIVDIYKKPNSNLLYAATKNDIFEITPTTLNSIKHIVVSIDEVNNNIPSNFELQQNYPNPFNPETAISYQLSEISFVTLKVFDLLGREVVTLVNEEKPAGTYEVKFDGNNLPSGIYFYRISVYTPGRAGDFSQTKKMVLLR